MSVNTGLSAVSDHLLMVAVVIYSLALLAYAGDFAYGRRARSAAQPVAQPVSELAGVGAGAGAGARGVDEPAAAGTSEASDGPADAEAEETPASGGSDAISPGGLEKGRQARGPLIRAAIALTFLGAALHLTGVITRGIAVDRVPWGDMYEFVTALTCVTVLFFIAVMLKYRAWHLGLFVMAAVVVALGLAQTVIYTPAGPLVPALNSYWLAIHVTAMTLASGTFMVGAVLAIVYLFAERHTRRVAAGLSTSYGEVFRLLPSAERLDQIAYRTVVFAFPIWTFGIMAGAIWADEAWGRYWGWDPTETWAFITWVVYACFLHARVTAGWRGRRAAFIQLLGFACLLFNLLGVSLFITGLHSYAGLS